MGAEELESRLCAGGAGTAVAQVSFKSAIELALKNSPRVKMAGRRPEKGFSTADIQERKAWADMLEVDGQLREALIYQVRQQGEIDEWLKSVRIPG